MDSDAAEVSISVGAINDAPTADPQSVSTTEDTALTIILIGSDPDDDPRTFAMATQPSNRMLSGAVPSVTYTPNGGFTGADSFTFTVNDGTVEGAEATVSITVTANQVIDPSTFASGKNVSNAYPNVTLSAARVTAEINDLDAITPLQLISDVTGPAFTNGSVFLTDAGSNLWFADIRFGDDALRVGFTPYHGRLS